ncbi:histidine phosphatase family protein [Aestuariispira ectoiniformans]|uniref:histidine phosphatase family protein n=1 Tax=Aestuariispira ectoiniformans TaxID=2775080 RepID=UPI00223AEF37|nr:histidine phosphatase family protein [Aestuariispira ectoiniformans]
MSKTTRWWWVRHAPVTAHKGTIYGQRDLPCDVDDTDTFKALATMLPDEAACITSTLQRTHQTADAIAAQGLTFAERQAEADLVEQSFGDWQGHSFAEFDHIRDNIAHRYWSAPAYERPPNGESFADVIARVAPAVTRLTAEHSGKDIVAVVHGGTIRAAIAFALGIDADKALAFAINNCSVTRLDHIDLGETQSWRINVVNWLPHTKHKTA